MSESNKESKEPTDAIFQVVQIPGQREYKQPVVAYQSVDREIDGQKVPGTTVVLEPTQLGQYVIPANHPQYKECVAAMKNKMKRENSGDQKVIIGPYETTEKALAEMHKARPKTDSETAEIEKSKREEVEKENTTLKAKIAEMEAKLKKDQK